MSKSGKSLDFVVRNGKCLILCGVLLICMVVVPIHYQRMWECLLEMIAAFQSIETARTYIGNYGVMAPAVSAILMVFQSVIVPFPAFLITFANGTLFGFWWGSLLSWSSAMLGAALCFYIARVLGIDRVARLISEPAMEKVNDFFDKYGRYTVLIARLVPFISFDVVSYAAGVTRIRFLHFWIATGIGQTPATLVYSYLGESTSSHIRWILFIFSIIIAVSTVRCLLKSGRQAPADA